jgi:hypothetical protein
METEKCKECYGQGSWQSDLNGVTLLCPRCGGNGEEPEWQEWQPGQRPAAAPPMTRRKKIGVAVTLLLLAAFFVWGVLIPLLR